MEGEERLGTRLVVSMTACYVQMTFPWTCYHDCQIVALQTLLDISACLSSSVSFSSVGEALHHAMTTVKQVTMQKLLLNS